MRKLIFALVLPTTFMSCDYFNNTSVCNQTRNEITLKITFDSDEVKRWSGGMLVKDVKKTFSDWDDNLTPVDIDTINYISIYKIKPDACVKIEGGNNRRPSFHFFKKIEIMTASDTVRLTTKEEMREAFDVAREDPNGKFSLLILEGGEKTSR